GSLTQLDRATAEGLRQGQQFVVNGEPVAEFLTLGPVDGDRHPVKVASGTIEAPVAGSWRRSVVRRVACDPDPGRSIGRVGTAALGDAALKQMEGPGAPKPLRVLIAEVLPDEPPRRGGVRVRVEVDRAIADRIRVGDRDMRGEPVDERNAVV